jgi:trimeric autotransporter adhesin
MLNPRAISWIVALAVAVSLGLTSATPAGVVNGNLPGGTSVSVSINVPLDGSVVQLGDPVPVSGTASVGEGAPVKDTTVVYVVDRSGSMMSTAGVDCNGVPGPETRLACVQRAIEQANTAAKAATSSVDLTGLASFHSSSAIPVLGGSDTGTAHDVNLGAAGVQLLTAPGADGNLNGNPDVEDVADGLVAFGNTCYSCGLSAAAAVLNDPANANTANIVIFLSDGFNNDGINVGSVGGLPAGTIIHSFALGDPANVSCAAPGTLLGSLNDVAGLTPGGTCTQTTNFADVGDVISQAIGSTLSSVGLTLDGGSVAIATASSLPAAGPTTTTWNSTTPLIGLSPGFHTLVATTNASDAGGPGSVADRHTFYVNSPPDCSAARTGLGDLWPPNHKLRKGQIAGVTDPDADPITLTITGITQDEPVDATGSGDGNTSPDASIGSSGAFEVRAERAGTGDGRVYVVAFTAADGVGGTCSATLFVGVPHDQGGGATPINSAPPSYDSTVG